MADPNIYAMVVMNLHPKIRQFIDRINDDGQIDLDPSGHPYLLRVEPRGQNHVIFLKRNGHEENFIINTRKRSEPLISWNPGDGFVRQANKRVISMDKEEDGPRRERSMRKIPFESFERVVDQIIRG